MNVRKLQTAKAKRPLAAFAESSDEEEAPPALKVTPKFKIPRVTAPKKPDIAEDSSAYLYDEVYDSIKKDDPQNQRKKAEKGAIYMDKLLKAKEQRQRDRLTVENLKVAKEREAEGDSFDDKESFLTSSYKKYKDEVEQTLAQEAAETRSGVGQLVQRIMQRGGDVTAPNVSSGKVSEHSETPAATEVNPAEGQELQEEPLKLSGGLNIMKKPTQKLRQEDVLDKNSKKHPESHEEKVIRFLLKHRTTEEQIQQARDRFLERRANR
ncbi:unnamed protein product [Kuraishia capsulata CBS 1993]|uniref:Nuclear speckle splicing regulatory protein 1 N-terminal domain-containing protein n=1 Tax=Kuraishia capsulata CBS 1993 TaxID=1382522 RepID=W6MJU2_9ASCO|nr:uncharacterized protein KUCA_T00002518001 [Kuraishia capsulata CBS 1993]CDK26546.1 unnamed protein product [Kuraishia capsulata CBS 1993]